MQTILGLLSFFGIIMALVSITEIYDHIRYLRYKNFFDKHSGKPQSIIYPIFSKRPFIFTVLWIALAIFMVCFPIYNYKNAFPDGFYCYYINVYTDEVSFMLPAEIMKTTGETESIETDHITGDISPVIIPNAEFYVGDAYFPDGRKLEFGDSQIYFNKETELSDQYNTYWHCRIINERAKHPKIRENIEPKSKIDLILGPIACVILIAEFTCLVRQYRREVHVVQS